MKEEQLIFIISQPRAGSTLLQRILSNNEQVGTTSESWTLFPFISVLNPRIIKSLYNPKYVNWAFMDYFQNDLNNYSNWLLNCLDNYYAFKSINKYQFIIDKTPRYYEIIFEIKQLFPKSKIILLFRNYLNVLHSIKTTWIDQKGIEFLINYYRDILYAPFIMKKFADKFNDDKNIITLQYESLISDPEYVINNACNKLGLVFNKSSLDYSNNYKTTGLLGDPIGIEKHSGPVNEKDDKWLKLLTLPYWNKFVPGYIDYLSPLLDESTSKLGRKTKVFNRYKKLSKNHFFN